MTLLDFVRIQRKNTIIHRIPIPVKILPFVYTILVPFICFLRQYQLISLVLIMFTLSVLFIYPLKEIRYIVSIYIAYLSLGVIVLGTHIIFGGYLLETVQRLLYILTIGFSFLFFLSTTKISDLERFLKKIHFPERIINYLITAYNLLPSVYFELEEISRAQMARGLELNQNPITKVRRSLAIFIPFLFVTLLRSQQLDESFKARGRD